MFITLLLSSCGYSWKLNDNDADEDGYTVAQGDCWDAVEGPASSELTGHDINPASQETWYDGVDQNCDGASDYDADQDGFDQDADCSDEDASVYPGALELCGDAKDSDCDGLDDSEDPDAQGQWYLDSDGDGYGTGEPMLVTGCTTTVENYASSPDDCDDNDSSVNPGAAEDCSATDRNCDGDPEAGAVDADNWYLDADGDTYGLASDRIASCTAPSGRVADATDCDDTNEDVHPDAIEVCDGADNDCDEKTDDEDDDVDPSTQKVWVYDGDQDGYGTNSPLCSDYVVCQCSQPLCFVDNFDDCDDNSEEIGICGDPGSGDLFECPISDDPECELPELDPSTCRPK